MALHGGTFVTYYNRSQVTHFICNNLPDVKLKQMQHERYKNLSTAFNKLVLTATEWMKLYALYLSFCRLFLPQITLLMMYSILYLCKYNVGTDFHSLPRV